MLVLIMIGAAAYMHMHLYDDYSFEDRAKDTLKISGEQVSPAELENTLLAHPRKLLTDACVAGVMVPGARLSDERVPRAWVVLSPAGEQIGKAEVVRLLDEWSRERLSKYKWLRGGIEIVNEVRVPYHIT
jgi:acyl-CoA synthetase (AMP-forming)/AMP-acid ligase II